jgi:hypothetical protein
MALNDQKEVETLCNARQDKLASWLTSKSSPYFPIYKLFLIMYL